ncbi:MAG TPA: fructose-bisphosphate aldolase [Armatimonadota bacterium]|nr:fructose-bisphosphate aldolase [Armatimonadota bacterium]
MKGKELRLRRFFSKGHTVIVPIDHPVYFGPLPGVADVKKIVSDIASTEADGTLLTLATMDRTVDEIGNLATIARIDGTHTKLGHNLEKIYQFSTVEHAVAAGADACILNVYVGTDNEDELLGKLGTVAEDCERWGLPLFSEMIPAGALRGHYDPTAEKLSEDELADQIALASRVGAELGADIIKTNYTGSPESFRRVVEGASVPVVVAGGPCGDSVAGLLKMVEDCVAAGAAGVCIGRNVWARENRVEVLNAICRIVHEGVAAEEALTR